jgi:hypothetical protein
VSGLGLDRLQRHAGLAQPGETGVPQLMTGQVRDPGAPARACDDLVQPGRAQQLTPPRALEHDEQPIRRRPGWSLEVKVGGQVGEESW